MTNINPSRKEKKVTHYMLLQTSNNEIMAYESLPHAG